MRQHIVSLVGLVSALACIQLHAEPDTNQVSKHLVEPWKDVTIKLVVPGASDSSPKASKVEETPAKEAFYNRASMPDSPVFLNHYSILNIHDPHTKKRILIDAGHSFYVSESSGMKGYTIWPGELFWTHSYLETPDTIAESAAIAHFDGVNIKKLDQELRNRLINRIHLNQVVPWNYFSEGPFAHACDVMPEVKAVELTNNILRLAIRNPKTQKDATIWIDLNAKKVTKSIVDGQEMDLSVIGTHKPFGVPLPPK